MNDLLKILSIFALACLIVLALDMLDTTETGPGSHTPPSCSSPGEPGRTFLQAEFGDEYENTWMASAFIFLDAIEWVESKGDPQAVGDNGNAVGSFQIHERYVDDVNMIMKRYVSGWQSIPYSDRWHRDKSRLMVTIYLTYYRDKMIHSLDSYDTADDFECMARIHNGGPDGWRNDPQWFVRNRDYVLEQAERKIANTKAYWLKVKARMEE